MLVQKVLNEEHFDVEMQYGGDIQITETKIDERSQEDPISAIRDPAQKTMSSVVRVTKRTISPIQVLKNRNMMTGVNLVEQVQLNNFKMNRNILTKSV